MAEVTTDFSYEECCLLDENCGAFTRNNVLEKMFMVSELDESVDDHFKYLKVNILITCLYFLQRYDKLCGHQFVTIKVCWYNEGLMSEF